MVFATPTSSYWTGAFIANITNPTGADALFTIANLLITSVFPRKTQALAGGVFNTVSQIGKSVGMALNAVLAASVTAQAPVIDKHSPPALMQGYRASFWLCFASKWNYGKRLTPADLRFVVIMLTFNTCLWGLRGVGKVGHKRD